jgi:hypothetical protein
VAERRVIPGLEVYPNFTTAVLLDIFCRHPETIALSYGFDTGAIQTIETEEGWRVETTSDNRIIAYC